MGGVVRERLVISKKLSATKIVISSLDQRDLGRSSGGPAAKQTLFGREKY